MNVRNCKSCGRMFNYFSGPPMCPKCRQSLEDKFQEVKKYVRDNPGCGMPEVSEACEVDLNQLRQWIREERLEFSDASSSGVACESCGTLIKSGRFCDKCKAKMANEIGGVVEAHKRATASVPAKKESTKSAMRFLDR